MFEEEEEECHCLVRDEDALHNWSMFPSDNGDLSVLLPQEAESEICDWLKKLAFSAGMIRNPGRLYGKIVFNSEGDIEDFEIGTLNYAMLQPGFKNWMNTLASGEVLLDIVNSLLELVPADVRSHYFPFVASNGLPVNRMVDNSPNLHGKCNFLRNLSTLIHGFLVPTLSSLDHSDSPDSDRGRCDVIRILKATRHHQYALLRCKYTTDIQDTWKALMMVVLALMTICGCLEDRLSRLLRYLTRENGTSGVVSKPLTEAYQILRSQAEPSSSELRKMQLHQCRFPFARVLKQGVIPNPRSLLSNCGDHEEPRSLYLRL